MDNLEIKNITKKYNKKTVLNNINFKVKNGEFLSILGPSGCGKTTLLKILIGIEEPTSGSICKGKKDITKLDPSKREMGMVFQNYALFPNMTVLENVTYALNLKLKNKDKAKEDSLKMLEIVNMSEHKNKYPHELSGGQQQRVGIARALAIEPEVSLFDEPTSALDPELVGGILDLIMKVAHDKTTMLLVTHEMSFAKQVSDHVIFLDKGSIAEEGTPEQIFDNPQNERTRQFIRGFEGSNLSLG